jgi:Flp pilus assembly protein protease CpaA
VAATVVAALLARYGVGARGALAAFAAVILVLLAAVDIEQRRVPNRIVLSAAVVVLVAHAAIEPARVWVWALAGAGAAGAFFVFAAISPAGLGMGDVKLMLLIGAAVGPAIFVALVLGTLSAAAAGVAVIVRHGGAGRRRSLPYVPFLAFGAVAALLLARP